MAASEKEAESTIYTASDALACKVSAVNAGYVLDPLVERMFNHVKRPHMTTRKSPIINRGYYARMKGVKLYLNRFMEAFPGNAQIVNLGCGFDTFSLNISKEFRGRLTIFEVDYPSVADKKFHIIQKDGILRESCLFSTYGTEDAADASSGSGAVQVTALEPPIAGGVTGGSSLSSSSSMPRVLPTVFEHALSQSQDLESEPVPASNIKASLSSSSSGDSSTTKIGDIYFIGADLTDKDAVLSKLTSCGFKADVPTFILSECVLVYLQKAYVESLIKSFGDLLPQSVWVSYDMTNPNDPFGKMMLKNLTEAGFRIPGLTDFPTFESLSQRFLQNSWEKSSVATMLDIFRKATSKEELKRIQKLEIFDEVEEFNLLMEHYGLTVASKGMSFDLL